MQFYIHITSRFLLCCLKDITKYDAHVSCNERTLVWNSEGVWHFFLASLYDYDEDSSFWMALKKNSVTKMPWKDFSGISYLKQYEQN